MNRVLNKKKPALFALLVSVGLILATLWWLPRLDVQDSHLTVFLAWLTAILLFLIAVSEPLSRNSWKPNFYALRNEILVVSIVLMLALFLRLWQVDSIPFTLAGDEASQGLESVRVLQGDLRNPFSTGWLGVPTMSFFFNSLTIGLLGQSVFALRLPWVLVGTATILTTYLLVRQLLGWRLALASAVILATYHYHIHYSRLGSNQIFDPFFLSMTLFLLYRGIDRQMKISWALAGVAAGLAFYFYAGARLTPVVIAGVLFYLFLLNPRRFWAMYGQGIAAMTGAFLITVAPMLQYAARFPDDFNARVNQVGIIQSGWLENEILVRGQPAVRILLDQFWRAVMAFNIYSDRTVWYGLPEPLLNSVFGAVFLAGLLYATLRLLNRQEGPRVVPMVVWWWGGVILGGMLTESPPSSQRLITLAVPVSFFIAYAVQEVLRLVNQTFGRKLTDVIMTVVVVSFAITSLNTYFWEYTPKRIYGGQDAELATQIAPKLNELKNDNIFYFLGPSFMYWNFATLPYLVPGVSALDLLEPLQEPLPSHMYPQDLGSVFIIVPERRDEVEILKSAFPDGESFDIISSANGRFLGTLFRVAPAP
jgi:4-amino-4-deoxy-L-arabinose transferase-like glycosyltransferase